MLTYESHYYFTQKITNYTFPAGGTNSHFFFFILCRTWSSIKLLSFALDLFIDQQQLSAVVVGHRENPFATLFSPNLLNLGTFATPTFWPPICFRHHTNWPQIHIGHPGILSSHPYHAILWGPPQTKSTNNDKCV